MKRFIYVFLLFCIPTIGLSQAFSIDIIDREFGQGCGQTTTNYRNNFDIRATTLNGVPTGYEVEDNGSATEDGRPCSYNNDRIESLTVNVALCDTFREFSSHCCDSERNEFIIVPNLNITSPLNPPINDEYTLVATPGFHPMVYNWQYRSLAGVWEDFPVALRGTSSVTFNAEEVFASEPDYTAYIGRVTPFRIAICNGWVSTETVQLGFIEPSIELRDIDPIQITDATCNSDNNTSIDNSNDGSITLNFEKNVETGFGMRYFIFQGRHTDFNGIVETADGVDFPDDVYDEVRFDPEEGTPLLSNGDGTFRGTYVGLDGQNTNPNAPQTQQNQQNYYIIYQEVNYDATPVVVKSGTLREETFIIRQPTQIEVALDVTQPSCPGESGTVIVNGTGGGFPPNPNATLEYGIQIDGGTIDWTNPTATFSNLDPANYKFYARSSNSCISAEPSNFTTINPTPVFEFDPTTTREGQNPSPGGNDGSIEVELNGGTSPITLEIYNDAVSTTIPVQSTELIGNDRNHIFPGLPAGIYSLRAVDDNMCSIDSPRTYELQSAAIPQITNLARVAPLCNNGTDGQVTVTLDPGTSQPYTYRLKEGDSSGPVILTDNGTAAEIIIDNLSPGLHTLEVIFTGTGDFNVPATVATDSFTIANPAPITVSISATPFTCFNSTDGALTVVATGATNYEYELSTDRGNWIRLVGNTISVNNPNFYEVTLRNLDIPSCVSAISNEVEVTRPLEISISEVVGNHVNVSANGLSDGGLEILVENGTPGYTYSWTRSETATTAKLSYTPPAPNSTNTNLVDIPFGFYQLTLTDDTTNCPDVLGPIIEITQPGPLDITAFSSTDTCNGLATGTLTATVEGTGDVVFEFLLNPGPGETVVYTETSTNRTVIVPNLGAGTYGLRITEVTSTDVQITDPVDYVTIAEVAEITANVAKTDVSCDGFTQGTITVSAVTGGSPFTTGPNAVSGYEYRIDDTFNTFQADAVFNNVPVGNYTLTVRDALGCEFNTTVAIIQDGAPVLNTLTTIVTTASSDTSSDGSIVLEFEDDPSTYTYNWVGAGVSVNNVKDQIGVPAGSYQVTVTASGNCTLVEQFTVGIADAFSVTNITATPTCFAPINGTLTATVEATGNVIHNWRNAADDSLVATETTNLRTVTATGLPAGIYYLEIVDAADNTITARSIDVEIIGQPDVNADIILTPACSGADTGSITFSNPTGSLTGDYLFSIDGGTNFVDTLVYNDLAAGTYQIVIRATDNTNCDKLIPNVVIQTSPILLYDAANTIVTRASGQGTTDGEITVAFAQGTAPYQYSIDNGVTSQLSPVFSGLGQGTYTIIATDAAGCSTASDQITVTEIGPLTISNIVPSNALCKNEATGTIQTTVTGEGTITYEWTLADGSAVPVSNGTDGEDITGILAGSYILTVTDDNATVSSPAIPIGEPATALGIQNVTSTDITCNSANDGTIQIVATGGTPPYQYSLNGTDFQNGNTFTNLQPVQYPITVRDANGCLVTAATPELLTEPLALSFIINEQRPLTAANAANGAILITPEGGSGNYTYGWTGPNYTSADEDIFGLVGGDYTLTLTDANNPNCSIVSTPITIAEPGVLIATNAQTVFLECNGDDFAEIVATAQGGVAPFTYEWFQVVNGNNNQLTEDTDIIANLSAGTYFVRITDANNVVADANPVIVNEPAVLQIEVDGTTNVLCNGEATGAIAISVTGGTFPYQYVWSNGLTVEDINGLEAGDYSIEVIDAMGCITEETITIATPDDAVQIADVTINNVSAYQALDGSILLDVQGGLAPYTYLWSRVSDNANVGNQASISNLAADSYTVTVSDANNCTIIETYEVTQPDIVEDTIVQPSCTGESNGSISVLVNQGNGTFTYAWSTGDTTNAITGLAAGSYSVTITGFGNGPLTRTYVLEDPAPLEVNLGADRVLCADQILELDATVEDPLATYSWSSDTGFTSTAPNVILTESGNYTVTVQTPTGCTAQGSIFVDISTDDIDAEFAVSSQVFAGERVLAVDISYPLPETIAWEIPLGAEIVTQDSDEVELIFATPGEYEIGITTTLGGCIAQKTKKIIVVAKNGAIEDDDARNGQKLVEDFLVYPNPTSGRFTADINLSERGTVSVKVFSFANNAMITSENDRGETAYSIPFDISGMPAGVYAVLLETSYGTSLRKIIVR